VLIHPFAVRSRDRRVALAALAGLLLAGCAATTRGGGQAVSSTAAAAAPADSATIVLEVRLRRSAELSDARGALRVFDQDLRVEYRAGGKGAGLDAGEVTLDGRPLRRSVDGKGAVSYRLGRDEPDGGSQAGGDPWATLANTGARVPAARPRVKLAPYPVVTRPTPGQGVLRADELLVTMLPPVPDVWYRVSLTGAGDPVTALDLGEGRWLFERGTLAGLTTGRARLLIEVETSCGDCPVAGALRANWSTRTELEVPLTLL
jgi:predicted small secreted protein